MKKVLSGALIIFLLLTALPTKALAWGIGVNTSGYYSYTVSNNEATIVNVDSSISGDIVIPTHLGEYPVTSIGSDAFVSCEGITGVTIPDGVVSISDYAFDNCYGIKHIDFGNGVKTIGRSAFSGCDSLKSLTIPDNVVLIAPEAFWGCEALVDVSIGSGLQTMFDSTFEYCVRIKNITVSDSNTRFASIDGVLFDKKIETLMYYPSCKEDKHYDIPDTVRKIDEWAFGYCRFLESVTIPEGVEEIGRCTFDNCRVLKKISLPDSLKVIGYMAFQDCGSLKSIQIPDGVTEIADYAFQGCETLSSINLPHSVTSIGKFTFDWCNSLKEIWYTGDESDRANIAIGYYNNCIENAQWRYNICDNYNHQYNSICDGDCNLCVWEREPHIYDNSCDLICNACGERKSWTVHSHSDCFTGYEEGIEVLGTWENTPTKSGVYGIDPYVYSSDFSSHFLRVIDKNNEEVKYNEKRGGWPLVKGQTYTLQLVYKYDKTPVSDIIFKSTDRADKLFPDTDAGEWYNDAINYVLGKELMTGYGSNGYFGTADGIQRQDFLVILARLDGINVSFYQRHDNTFPDMQRDSYYESAVMWGYDNGIVTGYENGDFGVGDKITREQLVTFFYRYAKYKGLDVSYTTAEKNKVKNTYTDYKNVSAYAEDAIIWAVTNGIISGKTSTTIVPDGNAQRCEVAQIIYNIFLNELFN